MASSDSIPVLVWRVQNKSEKGFLRANQGEVFIQLESGELLQGKKPEPITFDIQNMITLGGNGKSSLISIDSKYRVHLNPASACLHPYSYQSGQFIEDVFPPSTSGFYGRLQSGREDAIYSVHPIVNSTRCLLLIIDPLSERIYETHIIQPYEAEALALEDDIRIIDRLYSQSTSGKEQSREEILKILDRSSPNWEQISKIIRDVSIPNLELGNTMRNTLSLIVPASFPDEIREELMAFLAYVLESKIPEEDPLIHSFKFSSIPLIEGLLNGHLMFLVDNLEWPPYVKLMTLAARGQLESPKGTVSDLILNTPWLLFSQKCMELRPSWLNIAVRSARSLNKSNRIVLGLPTTKSEARKSKAAWKKRYAEITYGFRVIGHIDPSVLGLVELVYLGVAYRWSHRHMKFISRLGGISENSPHLQVMLVPISSAERLKRTLPSILSVNWSSRTLNLDLFDDKTGTWNVPVNKILDALDKKSSIKKLKKAFDNRTTTEIYQLSKEEARVADLVSEGVGSLYLETPEYLVNRGLDRKEIQSIISRLVVRKTMKLTYEVSDTRLMSLAIILQGQSESVTSLTFELLKGTPTSFARLDKTGENGVILTRLPEDSVYNIASQLTSRGMEYDINIRCMRPTTFRRYTSNLYQRLLREDGTWDDDISAFLSQARSKRKELSESNA